MAEQQEEDDGRGGKVMALIEKATNSTEPEVDPRLLKAIKTVVRYSDSELRLAAKTLISLMKRQHSQIRYLALLIIDELFMRSKMFRTLITENLEQLLSLAIGFRRNQPLPAPPSVASVLRSKAIEFLEKWNDSFGIHYRQIRLGYDYLKNNLKFQFPNLQANAARIQRERRERELKTKEILRKKFETLRESLPSIREEIDTTINEIMECLEIAKANDEDGLAMEPLDNEEEEEGFEEIRNPELRQIRFNSLMEAEKVHENIDNKPVFDVLRELYKLLVTKRLVSVQQWISVLIRVEVDDTRFRDSTLKEFIDTRNRVLATKIKCEESGCTLPNTTSSGEDDTIWEEAEVEFMKNSEDLTPVSTARLVSVEDAPECSNRRANNGETSNFRESASDPNSLRGKLLAEAPVVKWGSSLDNWGEKRDILANQRGLELDNHWGRVDHDATIPAEKIAELNVQATVYKEEPAEIQPCRAPLSKGGLCQRRDLRVCPFHGPIIPRDDEGIPIHLNDERKSMSRSPSTEEMNLDGKSILVEQLVKQAVKNVRERDKEDAKKKEIDKRAVKRAKLTKVREHNEAVLREAAMASTLTYAGIGEFKGSTSRERASSKNKKPTLASMLKKKVTTKDRLAQKLLSARARDATVKQLTQGDDTTYRESFPNQW